MDVRSGELIKKSIDELDKFLVPVEESDMTKKQQQDSKVSLHDHRSKLGKQLTKERANKGLTKRRYRTLRKKGILR